jgi:hypothetical protein
MPTGARDADLYSVPAATPGSAVSARGLETPPVAPVIASLAGDTRPGRPIDIIVDAPLQATHGSTFAVSVGIASDPAVESAKFHLFYDTDGLEMLDVVDAAGTTLQAVARGDGSVDLDYDASPTPTQAPSARFLVRTDAARLTYIVVTAEVKDRDGRGLPTTPLAPFPVMLVP